MRLKLTTLGIVSTIAWILVVLENLWNLHVNEALSLLSTSSSSLASSLLSPHTLQQQLQAAKDRVKQLQAQLELETTQDRIQQLESQLQQYPGASEEWKQVKQRLQLEYDQHDQLVENTNSNKEKEDRVRSIRQQQRTGNNTLLDSKSVNVKKHEPAMMYNNSCLAWHEDPYNSYQDGSVKCHYEPKTRARLCVFAEYAFSIDTSFLNVSKGGEPIDQVLDRPEEDEMFVAAPGAVYMKHPVKYRDMVPQSEKPKSVVITDDMIKKHTKERQKRRQQQQKAKAANANATNSSPQQQAQQSNQQAHTKSEQRHGRRALLQQQQQEQQKRQVIDQQNPQQAMQALEDRMSANSNNNAAKQPNENQAENQLPPVVRSKYYDGKLIKAANVNRKKCDTHITGLTLLYERSEYANLWHTLCDWFNVFWVLETLGHNFGTDKLTIIFLDGHAQGHLDEPWKIAFNATSVQHISSFQPKTVCFERAAWVPKESPLLLNRIYRNEKVPCGNMMDRFVRRFLTAYGIEPPSQNINLEDLPHVVIDRKPYLAHPRQKLLQANNDRVVDNLQERFPKAKLVQLENLTFREQLQAISHARKLSGVHGAGLTHMIWLPDGGEAEEWIAPSRRGVQLFKNMATNWLPRIHYNATYLAGFYDDPSKMSANTTTSGSTSSRATVKVVLP